MSIRSFNDFTSSKTQGTFINYEIENVTETLQEISDTVERLAKRFTNGFNNQLSDAANRSKDSILRTITLSMPGPGAGIIGYTRTGKPIYRPSQPGAPPGVRTGKLKLSINVELFSTNQDISIDVSWVPLYGYYLNYGTSRMAPRPFANQVIMNAWFSSFVTPYIRDAIRQGIQMVYQFDIKPDVDIDIDGLTREILSVLTFTTAGQRIRR